MSWLAERLRQLLDERNLSIQQVASGVGIERSYLSLIVHGRRVPSEDVVRRLARYFGEDEERWLFNARERPALNEMRRKYPKAMTEYARKTIEKTGRGRKRGYDLTSASYQAFLKRRDAGEIGVSDFVHLSAIEAEAREVLRAFGECLGGELAFPLDAELLVRKVASLEVHYDGEGYLDSIDRSLLGCLFPDGVTFPVTERDRTIVVNDAERFRSVTTAFTILHELGHYLLHYPKDAAGVSRPPTYCRPGDLSPARKGKVPPREWQANRFASEVLMPRDKVVEVLGGKKPGDLVNLKNHGDRFRRIFGVSQEAMEKRLFDLGYRCIMGRYGYANANLTDGG
jgi:transcriptional regulator with XRE-family HTH domain